MRGCELYDGAICRLENRLHILHVGNAGVCQGCKDGSRAWQILSTDIGGPETKNEGENDKKAEKECRRKVGTLVLPRRLEVVGVLVNFVYFYIIHNACVFLQSQLEKS